MADTEANVVEEHDAVVECSDAKKPVANDEKEAEIENAEEAPKAAENGGNEGEETPAAGEDEQQDKEKEIEKEIEKDPKESEPGHGTTVAKHYNEHPEGTREERRNSRIFHLRNFNNWIKSVLINEFLDKIRKNNPGDVNILDLACGKGGDLLKWQRAKVANVVCADIADVSIKQCEQRYRDLQRNRHSRRYTDPLFDLQFITADCTKEDLNTHYNENNKNAQFDMTSCQFALHYSFESQEQAEKMLQNACEKLKPGGYFIGTVPCAYELVRRLRESEDLSFGNKVYTVTFTEKEEFPLFGHKYDFHLDSVVDCPEFLVNFPLLEKMAEKFDMKLELSKNFHEFFHDNLESQKSLMYRMQALETYPPRRETDKLMSNEEDAYSEAKDFLDGAKAADKEEPSPKYRDHRNKGANHVGTLTKDEWEAAGMYMVFAFKKAEAEEPMEEDKAEEDKAEEDKAEEAKEPAGEASGEAEGNKGTAADEKKAEGDEQPEEAEKEEEGKVEDDAKTDEAEKEASAEDKGSEEVGMSEEAVVEGEEEEEETGEEETKEEEAKEEETKEEEAKEEEAKEEEAKEEEMKEEEMKEEETKEEEAKEEETKEEETKEEEAKEEEAKEEEAKEEEVKVITPQRGTRKRRSTADKKAEEADETKEEETETKPRRETRKRKSASGTAGIGDEEPPEKKKA